MSNTVAVASCAVNQIVYAEHRALFREAKAAGQSDQAVWDFVFPLVRGDVHDMNPDATMTAMAPQVHDATAEYIRIATDRLCSGERLTK